MRLLYRASDPRVLTAHVGEAFVVVLWSVPCKANIFAFALMFVLSTLDDASVGVWFPLVGAILIIGFSLGCGPLWRCPTLFGGSSWLCMIWGVRCTVAHCALYLLLVNTHCELVH